MFVITCNNQNYDSGGEYPIGYKNTEEEANAFCIIAREQLLEYQKVNGIIVMIDFLNDIEYTNEYKKLMDFFKDSHSFLTEIYKGRSSYRFFVQGSSIKDIESFIRSFKINSVSPIYNSYSVYSGNLSTFKGFDNYSDFYVYNIQELGNSI